MQLVILKKHEIPETWNSVEDFANWYIQNNVFLNFDKNTEVFCSDDATSVCLFRHGQFQVELYLIHPTPFVHWHEHPNVDVIKGRISNNVIMLTPILTNGEGHGENMRLEADTKGFPLLAFQYWRKGTPTTVASSWKGNTVGPLHEKLIKRFNPNALVKDGYADVTKTIDDLGAVKNVANS